MQNSYDCHLYSYHLTMSFSRSVVENRTEHSSAMMNNRTHESLQPIFPLACAPFGLREFPSLYFYFKTRLIRVSSRIRERVQEKCGAACRIFDEVSEIQSRSLVSRG